MQNKSKRFCEWARWNFHFHNSIHLWVNLRGKIATCNRCVMTARRKKPLADANVFDSIGTHFVLFISFGSHSNYFHFPRELVSFTKYCRFHTFGSCAFSVTSRGAVCFAEKKQVKSRTFGFFSTPPLVCYFTTQKPIKLIIPGTTLTFNHVTQSKLGSLRN